MSTHTLSPTTTAVSSALPPTSAPQIQACDSCKARKVRCIRSDFSSSSSGQIPPCDSCKRRQVPCTIMHVPKKRGPQPRPRTRERRRGFDQKAIRPRATADRRENPRSDSPILRTQTRTRVEEQEQLNGAHHDDVVRGLGVEMLLETSDLLGTSHLLNGYGTPLDGATSQISPTTPNVYFSLIPRPLLEFAISIYFKYVFGLVPIVHRPTFLADFHSRREERPGEDEWTALLVGVVGLTMAQVPWAFSSMSKAQCRVMVQRCFDYTKGYMFADFDKPTITRCILLYLGVIMATRLGHQGSRELCLGANWSLIYKLRLHEEASYADLDCIDAEIRRRLYWLALGFDKAASAVRGTPPMITREHCANVKLPTAIDDEFLTREGYLPSNGQTSLLSGFRYISRLYGLFGQVLDMRRLDQLQQPSGIALQMRLSEVDEIFDQMMNLMVGCPEELRLRETSSDSLSAALDWAGDAFAGIQALFEMDVPQTLVADSFLVQQANIFTAIQMARQLTLRYRADLRMLRRAEVQTRYTRISLMSESSPSAPMVLSEGEATMEEETERTAADLLKILKIIPIEVLAVNGDAVVNKVRFVAISQLETLDRLARPVDLTTDETDQPTGPGADKYRTAQTYLFDFLNILAGIEALFSLLDDPIPST